MTDTKSAKKKVRISKMPAQIGSHDCGIIKNDQLFAAHNGRLIPTGVYPKILGWGSYRTSCEIRPTAKVEGERHFKVASVNRIWVYLFGDVAIVEICGRHEMYGPPPIITDRATARDLWKNLD
jgi:hypothetical protein